MIEVYQTLFVQHVERRGLKRAEIYDLSEMHRAQIFSHNSQLMKRK